MWTAGPPEERLLTELADIAGRHQELANRLARHAELCAYPNIAGALGALAARQAEHARTLDALLSERHVWSKLPRPMGAEGSSNWQRVSGEKCFSADKIRQIPTRSYFAAEFGHAKSHRGGHISPNPVGNS